MQSNICSFEHDYTVFLRDQKSQDAFSNRVDAEVLRLLDTHKYNPFTKEHFAEALAEEIAESGFKDGSLSFEDQVFEHMQKGDLKEFFNGISKKYWSQQAEEQAMINVRADMDINFD